MLRKIRVPKEYLEEYLRRVTDPRCADQPSLFIQMNRERVEIELPLIHRTPRK